VENFVFMVNLSVEKRDALITVGLGFGQAFFEALNLKVATATVSVATAVWREPMSSHGGMALKTGTPAVTDCQAGNSRGSLASSRMKSSTYRYGRGGGVVGRGRGVGDGLTTVGVGVGVGVNVAEAVAVAVGVGVRVAVAVAVGVDVAVAVGVGVGVRVAVGETVAVGVGVAPPQIPSVSAVATVVEPL